MSAFLRFIFMLTILLFSAVSWANTINLHEQPIDSSKMVGTIDLSSGVIPIFTPKSSQWTKVADPRNGNTGWVKNSELKDSKGNVITFSQQFSDSGNGQSVQMMQSSGNMLTPEQKKKLEAQLQEQEKTAKETILKAQKNMFEVIDSLKKLYQQQLEIMQQTGFPVLMPPSSSMQQSNPNMPQPGMRQQPGMNQMQNQQQSGMPSMQGQPPYQQPGMQQGQMPGNQYQMPNQMPNQMQQPGSNKTGY